MIRVGELRRFVEELSDEYKSVFIDSFENSKSAWIETEDYRKIGVISKKPHTVEEIVGLLRETDEKTQLQESLLYANYDEAKSYYLPERVGLDACSFDVMIDDCDGQIFSEYIHTRTDAEQYPIIHTTVVSEDNFDKCIYIPGWDHCKYQKIEIIISPYFKVIFQYVYAVDKVTGEKRPNSYKVETRVKPPENHEVLGNISNYSFDQEIHAIFEGLDELEKMGIFINRSTIKVHSLELNLTFHMECDFSDLKRPLQYYQKYIDARYINSLYVYNGKKKKEFTWNDPEEKYAKLKLSGMQSKSKNIVVKLYDKAYETIYDAKYNKNPSQLISFEKYARLPKKSLVRLEFKILGKAAIFKYLSTTYLKGLDQDKILSAYQKLIDHYFVAPYEKYYEESSKKLKTLFKRMANEHITRRGYNWKIWLLQEIRSEEISSQNTPMCLESQDIEEFFWQVPTFAHDKNRYRKELYELLSTVHIFKKDYQNSYSILGNFFLKTRYFKGLSQSRRIGYTVDMEFDGIIKSMEKDTNYARIINNDFSKDRMLERINDKRKFREYIEYLDERKVKQLIENVDYIRDIIEEFGDGSYTTLHEDKEFLRFYNTFSDFVNYLYEMFEEKEDDFILSYPELDSMEEKLCELKNDMKTIYDNIFDED